MNQQHTSRTQNDEHQATLQTIAQQVMAKQGFLFGFSSEAIAELDKIQLPASNAEGPTRDLRQLLWCSIDNDDSRDLDQLTVAEEMPGGSVKILVAIADVDALVPKFSALDDHARHNTTSIYTAAGIFPMLPEKLSTDLTSLNKASDRLAVVVEMVFAGDGSLHTWDIYGAFVCSRAKLAYPSVAAWLDGVGEMPAEISGVNGLDANLHLQYSTAQKMNALRHLHGALDLDTLDTRPVFDGGELMDLETEEKNSAKALIEDLMIAANESSARYLSSKKFPSLRRVVRTPKRWSRIVELAADRGTALPADPDSPALERFLVSMKAADPLHFPDLSLSVIKLLGAGEYVVDLDGRHAEGHFGLAVRDYTHSTAPNRRYPDLITQRMLKAAAANEPVPYETDELMLLASHCTRQENASAKVERQITKSAAAILLESRIGEQFDAIVTGASDKGTWVRLMHPSVEGRLEIGFEGMDVGQAVRVELLRTDVERGYIDFKRVN